MSKSIAIVYNSISIYCYYLYIVGNVLYALNAVFVVDEVY